MYTNLFNDVTGTPRIATSTTRAQLALAATALQGARALIVRADPANAANIVLIGENDVTSAGGGSVITALAAADPPIIIPVPRANELYVVASAGTPGLYVGVLT